MKFISPTDGLINGFLWGYFTPISGVMGPYNIIAVQQPFNVRVYLPDPMSQIQATPLATHLLEVFDDLCLLESQLGCILERNIGI